jgi:hypothetical protein
MRRGFLHLVAIMAFRSVASASCSGERNRPSLRNAPRITKQVAGFKAVTLTEGEHGVFAEAAHVLELPESL